MKAIPGNRIAPGLIDRYLAKTGYAGQLIDEPLPADRPSNLFEPVPGNYGAHGRFDDSSRRRSIELFTDRHCTVFYALGLAAFGLLAHRAAKRPDV